MYVSPTQYTYNNKIFIKNKVNEMEQKKKLVVTGPFIESA